MTMTMTKKTKSMAAIAAEMTEGDLIALAYEAGVAGDTGTRDMARRAAAGSTRARSEIARLYMDGRLVRADED